MSPRRFLAFAREHADRVAFAHDTLEQHARVQAAPARVLLVRDPDKLSVGERPRDRVAGRRRSGELDDDLARRIGAAFAAWSGAPAIVIGRDCRISSPELAAALTEGATSAGADVVDLGLASTDLLYFASGSLSMPGVMLTASHNPPNYNGLKFCLAGARPVGEDTGLAPVADGAESAAPEVPGERRRRPRLKRAS